MREAIEAREQMLTRSRRLQWMQCGQFGGKESVLNKFPAYVNAPTIGRCMKCMRVFPLGQASVQTS